MDKRPAWVEDARQVLGLLAEPERLRVAAAVALGHATLSDVVRATGMPARDVERALARLNAGGLIVHEEGAGFRFAVETLKVVARAAAESEPEESLDAPPDDVKVLRSFVRGGRLQSIPVAHSKRLVVLDHLAQEFEPGRRYDERAVNSILSRFHDDVAALRRYLVDEGFLTRDRGRYWRTGGRFEVD
ncbi:MAG TPA: DUF2087 domain-containing protein [Actinomycetota bacterium]|nr:DUF2087 domain-containing protein [Actinomycetota bacterium]